MKRTQTSKNWQIREIDAASSYSHVVWEELAMLRCGFGCFQYEINPLGLGIRISSSFFRAWICKVNASQSGDLR
jgi:hypothetical protein